MSSHLPERFDPVDFAEKQRTLSGELPVKQLDRVCDLLHHADGAVTLDLSLDRQHHVPLIQGRLRVRLVLACQICLEPMPLELDLDVQLGVVQTLEQADRLPEGIEPLMPDPEGMVTLLDIVQDEILLALPVIPQHERCGAGVSDKLAEPEIPVRRRQDNPFAVLAALKK